MLRTGEVRFVAQGDWGSRPNLSTSMSLTGDVIVAVDADFWRNAPSPLRRAVVEEHVGSVVREIAAMKLPSDLIRRWAWTAALAYTGGSAVVAGLVNPAASLPSALAVALLSRFVSPHWLLLPLRPLANFYVRRLFDKALKGPAPPTARRSLSPRAEAG